MKDDKIILIILYWKLLNIKCIVFSIRSIVSSEISEEDLELLSKTINLSGFDDNISPCNHINLLLRFAIGEARIFLLVMCILLC